MTVLLAICIFFLVCLIYLMFEVHRAPYRPDLDPEYEPYEVWIARMREDIE